ncbi:MAG: hypothetical protein V9E89_04235 [Ilumatobacteraceae bacterium]
MSLAVVLLTPVTVVLMFLGFQAAMWNHAATEVRVVARQTAMMVARDGMPAGQAAGAGRAALSGTLTGVSVTVQRGASDVVVVVRGSAPGILRGTSWDVVVQVAVPAEGWAPL